MRRCQNSLQFMSINQLKMQGIRRFQEKRKGDMGYGGGMGVKGGVKEEAVEKFVNGDSPKSGKSAKSSGSESTEATGCLGIVSKQSMGSTLPEPLSYSQTDQQTHSQVLPPFCQHPEGQTHKGSATVSSLSNIFQGSELVESVRNLEVRGERLEERKREERGQVGDGGERVCGLIRRVLREGEEKLREIGSCGGNVMEVTGNNVEFQSVFKQTQSCLVTTLSKLTIYHQILTQISQIVHEFPLITPNTPKNPKTSLLTQLQSQLFDLQIIKTSLEEENQQLRKDLEIYSSEEWKRRNKEIRLGYEELKGREKEREREVEGLREEVRRLREEMEGMRLEGKKRQEVKSKQTSPNKPVIATAQQSQIQALPQPPTFDVSLSSKLLKLKQMSLPPQYDQPQNPSNRSRKGSLSRRPTIAPGFNLYP